MNALVFLYDKFLQRPLGGLDFNRANKPRRLPVVLNRSEVQAIFNQLDGRNRLLFALLYGSGLRITECLRLRVKDINFDAGSLTVHDGKGGKDRVTLLPSSLHDSLHQQIEESLPIQLEDNQRGVGPSLPGVLGKKYPNAFRQPAWTLLFPSSGLCLHPHTGINCRHHLHDSVPCKALKIAVANSGIAVTAEAVC
ncbi:tyrosine-type recombinase/integrase [Oceanobacter antarcticus]|uniref:Tyrosine-type recombinase/integrase n=1 Tax=Oceanobacter antarcticus TaxID=3133425 RepID=A0ABW8NH91_9GAMM